jgi:hypothetical protein
MAPILRRLSAKHTSLNVCNGMDAPTFSGIVVCQSGGANQPLEQKERPI